MYLNLVISCLIQKKVCVRYDVFCRFMSNLMQVMIFPEVLSTQKYNPTDAFCTHRKPYFVNSISFPNLHLILEDPYFNLHCGCTLFVISFMKNSRWPLVTL